MAQFYPSGMLGVGLTALMASFMSGMAGNVTAFNTVWTYDIYQSYIRKHAPDSHYLLGGPHHHRGGRGAVDRDGVPGAATSTTSWICCSWCSASSMRRCLRHSCWACSGSAPPATARLPDLLAGTAAAAATHGLTVAEGKGGWLGSVVHTFPSTMAQNFWIAIFAWSTCFLVTILVSLMSQPKPESELHNLVYGLTDIPHEDSCRGTSGRRLWR